MKTKAQELGITEFPYYEYDNKGNVTYYETSCGYWSKTEFDKYGDETYWENSYGSWYKSEQDDKGNVTYYEYSDGTKQYVIT
tara:strand:- start:50 stop:295 length:246 start_codon:yes stop_codon:yes gene_type:complete